MIKLIFFSVPLLFATNKDESVLKSLRAKYAECAEVLACKQQAFNLIAKKYCKESANNCQHSLNEDFGFLDPKRCENSKDCQMVDDKGTKAARLSIGPHNKCHQTQDPKDTVRAELSDTFNSNDEVPMEYSYEMRMPDYKNLNTRGDSKTDVAPKDRSLVVAQLHATNDKSPPFALRLKGDGRLVGTIRHDRTASGISSLAADNNGHQAGPQEMGSYTPGELLRIKIQSKPGYKGFLKVYINDRIVWNYKGPMGYNKTQYYFKMGPYDYSCTQSKEFSVDYSNYTRKSMTNTDSTPAAVRSNEPMISK